MFKNASDRTPAEIAADEANNNWVTERRNLRPTATVNDFAGSSRVPEFAKNDPAQIKAQREAERKNAERLAKLTKKERFAVRRVALTQSWHSPEMRTLRQSLESELAAHLDVLMEQANTKVPEKMFSTADWTYVIGLAKDNFNCDLESWNLSALTPEEGLALVHFCRAQDPPLYLGSESNLRIAFECLKAFGAIRSAQPEAVTEPEPVEPEKNPYRWDGNPSDYAIWDMNKMREARHEEMRERTVSPILSAASSKHCGLFGKAVQFRRSDQAGNGSRDGPVRCGVNSQLQESSHRIVGSGQRRSVAGRDCRARRCRAEFRRDEAEVRFHKLVRSE
jgi:hypothetical protein